ncbi:MAG: efflux transporter periplasmic adaptor subunit, partial [Cyclobacteriaceae bacterium]
AIIIPQKAVFEIQDRSFVYVVGENNQVEMRSFIPRARFSHYYIVESGLVAGESLVFEGIQNIKDGMTISPKIVSTDMDMPETGQEEPVAEVLNTTFEN